MQPDDKDISYYSQTDINVLERVLAASDHGLSEKEAESRIKLHGKNVLAEKERLNFLLEYIYHFKNPLVLILIIATIFSAFLSEKINAIILGSMVFLSVTLEFIQEHSAQKAAKKLEEHLKTKTTVLRDGQKKSVLVEDVCVGDIVFLEAGCLVPADCRVLDAKDFFVNQSSLTGESFPVEKRIASKQSDNENIAFLGTNVVSGEAKALVIRTGMHTEFGKISKSLSSESPETDFDKGIKNFGYLIMKLTIFLVLFIFLFNSVVRQNIFESFMFSVAVAVGLTPELLPMIMSINMAKGSIKMAQKGVIVKRLASIPNFGSMDILCTDKTGTLTEDHIQLVKYMDVYGKESEDVLFNAYLNSFYHTGIKNPLDSALLEFKHLKVAAFRKVDEIPFDFVRRKMSIVVKKGQKHILISKGAPEEIFRCSHHFISKGKKVTLKPGVEEKIRQQYYGLSKSGFRVLAVAIKDVPQKKVYTKHDECDLTLLGFVAFLDPPKSGIGHVIQELEDAGIVVKIITGDNELVTQKICDDIGLKVKGIILGHEMSELSEEALLVRVEKTTIFARFSPDQKNRIITALRKNNHVVGYLGDGINDAPSLKTSDIGISVKSAVDVAKESADIVLTHKSLDALLDGVFEGRKTFGNTMKYIMMGLSSNFGNMFSVAVAVLFLPFLPMLPIQIILNNMIYDFSQIAIPTDKVDDEFIKRPKRWNMAFIKKFMITLGPISSIFDIITFVLLFFVFKVSPEVFRTGWFLESIATQTLVIHIIRTKKTPFISSIASWPLLVGTLVSVSFAWVLPYTFFGRYFKLEPLPLDILLYIGLLVVIYLIVVELVKRWFYRRHDF